MTLTWQQVAPQLNADPSGSTTASTITEVITVDSIEIEFLNFCG
jgi:hypothetical protein